MQIEAAVSREQHKPFAFETLTLVPPRDDELLIRIVAVGICHTDLAVRDGDIPIPCSPSVLGHEGAGVVEACGSAVDGFEVGDHVVLSFASCGQCEPCKAGAPARCEDFMNYNLSGRRHDGSATLLSGDEALNANFFGQSSFASYSVVNSRYAVRVPKDLPLEYLAPLGCGIQTGFGSVTNGLRPAAGESLVVFGAGAVGLSAIMAGKALGCNPIIAVDLVDDRLDLARELGATNTFNPRRESSVDLVRELTQGGARHVVEASGNCTAIADAILCVRRFGSVALVGCPPVGSTVTIDGLALLSGAQIFGVNLGDCDPKTSIPQLIELYRSGKLPLERLIKLYDFSDINTAAAESLDGSVIKPVIRMSA